MKLSNKPRHFASFKKMLAWHKNRPGHKSDGFAWKRNKRNIPTPADIVRLFMGSLSRRTRQAYIAKQRNVEKT